MSTPGPWYFSGGRYVTTALPDRKFIICQLSDVGSTAPETEQFGNGCILAAAPDMLEALRQILNHGATAYNLGLAQDAVSKAEDR